MLRAVSVWATLLSFAFAPRLPAQTLELRVAGGAPDTVWITPDDTARLTVRGRTASGSLVTASAVGVVSAPGCALAVASAGRLTVAEAHDAPTDCNALLGWIVVRGTVSGVVVRDSIYLARPGFVPGSDRDVCLTTTPRTLRYAAAPDTVIALAIEGRTQRIAMAWSALRFPVDFGWQAGTKILQLSAIACMPAYTARDVTRSTLTRWVSADTTIATVSRGTLTWRTPAPWTVSAAWPVR